MKVSVSMAEEGREGEDGATPGRTLQAVLRLAFNWVKWEWWEAWHRGGLCLNELLPGSVAAVRRDCSQGRQRADCGGRSVRKHLR